MEISKNEFDLFIVWLKSDGLCPKKSERLWKKTIFSNLLHDDHKTVANFLDFKQGQLVRMLLNSTVSYSGINSPINNVELLESEFLITTLDYHNIRINIDEIDHFLANCCIQGQLNG